MTLEKMAHLSANLPMLIRGIFFEGWDPSEQPVKMKKGEFLDVVKREFVRNEPNIGAEKMTRAVFEILSDQVEKGEIDNVKEALPKDIRDPWPVETRI